MAENKKDPSLQIVFFDGVCNLCNGFIDFLIQNETAKSNLRFASLQGETAKAYLPSVDRESLQSVLFWDRGEILSESDAVLRILSQLKSPWKWLALLARPFPHLIRDTVYRWVARNRYQWFGKKDTCRLPTAEEKNQFLP